MAEQSTQSNQGSGVQELISRIRDEGVSAGREEAERLVEAAKRTSERMLKDAQQEIDALRRSAEIEIEADREAALEALKLAARDTGLELEAAVVAAFERQVTRLVSEITLDAELLRAMVLVLAGHSVKEFVQEKKIRVLASSLVFADQSDPEVSTRARKATLALSSDMLREGVELIPADDVTGGVRVQVVDEDLEINLTDEAISRLLLRHLLPKFRNILTGAE